jgi:hypothetical protein
VKSSVRVFLAATLNTKTVIPLLRTTMELKDHDLHEVCLNFALSNIRAVLDQEQLGPTISSVILERLKTILGVQHTQPEPAED